jgi:multiple sugar transport system permease protein
MATRVEVPEAPRDLPARGATKRSPALRRVRRWLTAYAFLAPAIALFAVFGVYTVVYGFLLSFNNWNGLAPHWTWVGLQNFKTLVSDEIIGPQVRKSVGITAIVMVALPTLVVAISLPLAFALNSIRRFQTALRTIYFLPYVTFGIAIFYAWRFMYDPDGVVNATLRAIGLDRLAPLDGFLGSTSTALPATIAVLVWASVPLGILLYLTGLQTIDQSLLEAARLEGAGVLMLLRRVVWPLLAPITALLVIIMMREALQGFALFLLMTNGGPLESTNVLGLETYTLSFGARSTNLGLASALGWSLFVVALILSLINLRLLRSRTQVR